MAKTLGDEIRDENYHHQWLIENGKLYDAMKQRAEAAESRAAQLQAERDELIEKLERSEERAKSNGEMWSQANRLYEYATQDALNYAVQCRRMRDELELVKSERDMLKAALEINSVTR